MTHATVDGRASDIGTPWRSGRLDGRGGPPRLLFGRTFEDPAIEERLFPVGGTVLCIASAGDTARRLAAGGRSVIAVDINPAQVTEVRRRLAGLAPRAGAADRLLASGRSALRPMGWRPSRLERFCDLADPGEQQHEWHRLCSRPVRAVTRVALSRAPLRLAFGAPFAALVPPRFGDRLLDRIGERVVLAPNRDNPWLRHLLTGEWRPPDPDPDVDRGRIDLRCADVASVLEAMAPASIDGISLSNVLDGPGPAYAERLRAAAHRAARPGSAIVVRSFLTSDDPTARSLAAADRSMLWGGISVERA